MSDLNELCKNEVLREKYKQLKTIFEKEATIIRYIKDKIDLINTLLINRMTEELIKELENVLNRTKADLKLNEMLIKHTIEDLDKLEEKLKINNSFKTDVVYMLYTEINGDEGTSSNKGGASKKKNSNTVKKSTKSKK